MRDIKPSVKFFLSVSLISIFSAYDSAATCKLTTVREVQEIEGKYPEIKKGTCRDGFKYKNGGWTSSDPVIKSCEKEAGGWYLYSLTESDLAAICKDWNAFKRGGRR